MVEAFIKSHVGEARLHLVHDRLDLQFLALVVDDDAVTGMATLNPFQLPLSDDKCLRDQEVFEQEQAQSQERDTRDCAFETANLGQYLGHGHRLEGEDKHGVLISENLYVIIADGVDEKSAGVFGLVNWLHNNGTIALVEVIIDRRHAELVARVRAEHGHDILSFA